MHRRGPPLPSSCMRRPSLALSPRIWTYNLHRISIMVKSTETRSRNWHPSHSQLWRLNDESWCPYNSVLAAMDLRDGTTHRSWTMACPWGWLPAPSIAFHPSVLRKTFAEHFWAYNLPQHCWVGHMSASSKISCFDPTRATTASLITTSQAPEGYHDSSNHY